ncbi:Methyl-CpG-binding domain-containing protein 8 [Spatholobus suberectus]|nr:Methyl-CpG-binding domain-containing protein 8 [Spatholobus suberectus]
MAMATPEPSPDHIDSLPLVDLRLLSQSELYTLSLSGDTPRHRHGDDDSVIPKIDRSNFNESAGSRKQTYSKLRLNKQKQNSAVPASSFHIPLHIPEPLDEENSQIIALLQQLFGIESLRNAPRLNDAEDRRLVPVQVEFKQPPPESATFQNVPIDVVDSGQRKRKRGRPRKNENSVTVFVEEPREVNGHGNGEGNAVAAVSETGFVVDAVRLDGDPFGEELKRRTQGLETESQLLEFLETMNGEWASQRKKRRIVPASDLGDLLPAGWKIVITLLRRAGRGSVVCRRYVSPGGHQFDSCKEVSAYLHSVPGVQDRIHLRSSYTDGAQQMSSSMSMASESRVGHVPTGGMKTDANASYLSLVGACAHFNHEKQAPISSSIGSENFNNDLALGCKLGDATGDFDHQTEDKELLKAYKNDGNSVQGCSLMEDRVCNVHNENLVGAGDAACNFYIPLVLSTPFFNNNSDNGQISDEINVTTCIKGGISNVASQDRNTGCYETVPCGNEQAHVGNNGLGLSVKLVEENIQKISFESSLLAPNSEGKIFASKNLEDRHLISSLEDMEIRDGKAIKNDKQQIICSRDQAEIKDVPTNIKLRSSSEGCSLVSSQDELKHTCISNMDRTQTSMLKDSAEENIFDSDLFSSSIDERICVHSGYISNISFSSCTQDASEYDGFDFASDLKLTKDVNDNHILSNEEGVTRCFQGRSSLNDQHNMMDNLLHRSSQSNLFALTGNQHPSAFHDNVNNISDGTFDALKAVDAGCMEPQLGIVSCSNIAVDAYTTASIMQGKSQGCVSVPFGGSILNFEKQSDDGVNKANKSCLPEKAQNEVEIFQTDSMGLPKFR